MEGVWCAGGLVWIKGLGGVVMGGVGLDNRWKWKWVGCAVFAEIREL